MAVDFTHGKIYWSETGLPGIRRANLDGTGIESVVQTSSRASGIALDIAAGKMYWTDATAETGQIHRADLDGGHAETIVPKGPISPAAIAVDLLHNRLYWTDLEGNLDRKGKIVRATLNGSNVQTIIQEIDEANGIAIDPLDGRIYWPELATHRIQRANLDGTDVQDVITGLNTPTTVGLDLLKVAPLTSLVYSLN
jgi:low density lipoprotein receptor-related protein 5/6